MANRPNELIEMDGFYLSYNPDPRSVFDLMAGVASTSETAICKPRGDNKGCDFYILNGDWRDVLRGKTLAQCLDVFCANPEHHSQWTNKPDN